jgi:protein-disulfide isomerase
MLAAATTGATTSTLITAEGQQRILGPPAAPRVGSTAPEVAIVEYFDYNCPTCKGLSSTLRALLAADPGVALIYKDWPILGPVSVYAARCALAATWQDKYQQAHDALLEGPRLSQNAQVDAALLRAGIDMPRLKEDRERHAGTIDALLSHDDDEARALGLQGTPGVLVGRRLLSGAVNLVTLQELVADARHAEIGLRDRQ